MKDIKSICVSSFIFLSILLSACQKEKDISEPVIRSVSFYHPDMNKKDSLVTTISTSKPLIIKVDTDGELGTVWPAGDRVVRKTILNPSIDSTDGFGNVVLVRSDDYKDYNLTGARGIVMSGTAVTGYSIIYSLYRVPGTYKLTVIATKHGYKGPGAKSFTFSQNVIVQ